MDLETIRLMSLAAGLLVLAAAAIVITLHLVRTGVDPWLDGVSAYAISPFGWLYRVQAIATGLAALLLTTVIIAGGLASGVAVILLGTFGASRIVITRYPTDPRGTTSFSRGGRYHIVLAAITFTTIAFAAPALGGTLTASPDWTGPDDVLTIIGWATTVCALGTFASTMTPVTRRVFGLVERGAYAGMLGWLAVAAAGVNAAA